jgi:DNA helicase HerA-like ATPase
MTSLKTIRFALNKETKRPYSIDPVGLMKHSLILAQSGSGKSFMIGRLLEELILETKANIVILDPNSDFIRLEQPDEFKWKDKKLKPWFYPGDSLKKFLSKWNSTKKIVVASNRNLEDACRIVMDWGSLDSYQMAAISGINIQNDSDLYWYLFLTRQIALETWDGEDEVYYDFEHFREKSDEIIKFIMSGRGSALIKENPLAQTLKRSTGGATALRFRAILDALADYEIWRSRGDGEIDVCDFVDTSSSHQALVIDFQSLSRQEERISVATRILVTLWNKRREAHWEATRDFQKSDTRVPLFLVIDEAHNLIPREKQNSAIQKLSGEIIRVAAEGRKYGIYLIVATQRPRRLDSSVLTECDNLFLMKTNNDQDIKFITDTLGFLNSDVAENAKSFSVGDIIIAGSVDSKGHVLHVSPRRTYEGGKGISETYWLQR